MRPLIKKANDSIAPLISYPVLPRSRERKISLFSVRQSEIWVRDYRLCKGIQGKRARSIQPKFPEISVQNSMDRFGPTGKVSKKRVHLLRWTTFPCRTGWNFGWMNCALGFWIHMEIAQSKYCTQSGFISQLTGLDSGSQSLVGSGLFHLGCIPDSKAQDSRFHKQKNMTNLFYRYIRDIDQNHIIFVIREEWKNFTIHFGQIGGAFHLTNTQIWNFGKSTWPLQRYIPVTHTRPKPPRVWLLLL